MTSSSFSRARLIVLLCALAGCSSGSSKPANPPKPATPEPGLITSEDLAKYPGEPIERLIQRKVPGLLVSKGTDGGLVLRIRGAGTAADRPLFVIDDIVTDPGPGGSLQTIDPYNIESIKVLRGAEAGLYGIRGLDGVIVIKMKKPAGRKQ